jgi:hypothetical protein
MKKRDLIEAMKDLSDDEEVYVVKDIRDEWDDQEFVSATMAHKIEALVDGGALVEVPEEYETEYVKDVIKTIFILY